MADIEKVREIMRTMDSPAESREALERDVSSLLDELGGNTGLVVFGASFLATYDRAMNAARPLAS